MICAACNGVIWLDIAQHIWRHTGEQRHPVTFNLRHIPPPGTGTSDNLGYSDTWRERVATFKRLYHTKPPAHTLFGLDG